MTHLLPGKIIHTFTTGKNQQAVIRYPKWEDLDMMVEYINKLSYEDTFITFSGETIGKEGEMYYLSEMMKSMEEKNSVYTGCFINEKLVGNCTVIRDMQARKRSYHVGIFGIAIAKEYRGEGIGKELAKVTIEEAKKTISGIRMLTLNVYSPNTIAQNLYKKLGFREFARLPGGIWYKGEYVDEIKMYKTI